jgi:hypothetical protein
VLQVAVLVGLAGLPWVVKPLYGFISDSVPLFGYRRRSYLMLCGLAGARADSAAAAAAVCVVELTVVMQQMAQLPHAVQAGRCVLEVMQTAG